MWIHSIDEGEATGELAELYRANLDPESGRLDWILKVHGLHAEGLSAHVALYRAVMKPTRSLPKAEREMIALVVSTINECHY
jgi:alkylhydroperoxidase family enzyme